MKRGIVSSRVALLLRSTEIQPAVSKIRAPERTFPSLVHYMLQGMFVGFPRLALSQRPAVHTIISLYTVHTIHDAFGIYEGLAFWRYGWGIVLEVCMGHCFFPL